MYDVSVLIAEAVAVTYDTCVEQTVLAEVAVTFAYIVLMEVVIAAQH